jgi:GTP-binding protein Era
MRCGTVAIVGRTNVGKSTFLNACLGERIAIVSALPQTTRDELLGVVHRPNAQIAFTDTPGFHRPKTELGRRMNQRALDTARSHDLVVFMTDVTRLKYLRESTTGEPQDPIAADDRRLLRILPPQTPSILVLNKVDLVKNKSTLLPLIAAFDEAHSFDAIIPTSVLNNDGVQLVLDEIERRLPEAPLRYEPDELTDKPATFFVREYVREQVMQLTRREVPHAVAVTVERYDEGEKLLRIQATIHVEKAGQRAILVGQRGQGIKTIGIGARARLEELLGKQVHLELFVRVTERWKDVPRQLREMGYDGVGGRDLSSALPKASKPRPPNKPSKKTTKRKPTSTNNPKREQGSAESQRNSSRRAARASKRDSRGAAKPHDKPKTGKVRGRAKKASQQRTGASRKGKRK